MPRMEIESVIDGKFKSEHGGCDEPMLTVVGSDHDAGVADAIWLGAIGSGIGYRNIAWRDLVLVIRSFVEFHVLGEIADRAGKCKPDNVGCAVDSVSAVVQGMKALAFVIVKNIVIAARFQEPLEVLFVVKAADHNAVV